MRHQDRDNRVEVADAHRGEIGIETAPGGGTLMRIRMIGVAPEGAHANLARSA